MMGYAGVRTGRHQRGGGHCAPAGPSSRRRDLRDAGVAAAPVRPAELLGVVDQMMAGTRVWGAGPRWGWMQLPSGSSSPVSSKMITPLHRRLHPCSGWQEMTRAASRSTASALGQGGWCSHICCFSDVGVAVVTVTKNARYS